MMCILVLFLLLGVCTGSNITRRAFKCGGPEYLTATSGLIDSHGGHEAGLNYGKDMDCVWTIEAARGMYVQIWPETFDIENETRCGYDYLELLDGDSIHARNMGRFCGTFMDAISSTQRFLTVHFVTDGDVQLSGFRLRYNFTDVTLRVCDPVEYRCNNSKCVPASYLCDADDDCGDASDELSCTGRVVTCAQDEFLCRDRTDCVLLSWLCDGDNDCGDSSDELTTNCLTAATTTRPVMVNSVTCGQLNRTGISGTISSPNYPANYGNDILCQWIVKATPGTKSATETLPEIFGSHPTKEATAP